jgi:hypothetical protein
MTAPPGSRQYFWATIIEAIRCDAAKRRRHAAGNTRDRAADAAHGGDDSQSDQTSQHSKAKQEGLDAFQNDFPAMRQRLDAEFKNLIDPPPSKQTTIATAKA